MRKHKKLAAILTACLMSAVMACTALAPCASAAEVQDPAEIEQYNLAGEDWDELLGLKEPAVEETPVEEEVVSETVSEVQGADWAAGLKSSDGGMSKLLIIAIIAFALGGIGVTFFIYSQFIYKAKLKRKLAAKQAEEEAAAAKNDFNMEGPVKLDFTDHRKETPAEEQKPAVPAEKTHTQKVNDFFAEFEKETKGVSKPNPDPFANRVKKPAEPADSTGLSREDEKKLDSVNWDDFFNKH